MTEPQTEARVRDAVRRATGRDASAAKVTRLAGHASMRSYWRVGTPAASWPPRGADGLALGLPARPSHVVMVPPPDAKPEEVILLDMVGGDSVANARVGTRPGGNDVFDLPIERHSNSAAPELVDEVYSAAAELGHAAFKQRVGYSVIDDHMPFIAAGIPAIDLIEFDYPEWHTVDDTPDHCDADSLRQVGETLLHVVYARG